jgi:hypothetical protein
MFTKLKLSKDFTIFTSTITNIDNSLLVKDLVYNCDISKKTISHEKSPGVQSKICVVSKNIEDIRNEILKKVILHFKLKENYLISYDDWVFISENTNNQSNYHDHLSEGNLKLVKEPPQWSIVYYAEMPNNLQGNDGFLYFLTKDKKEVSILPLENQVIMFPSNVLHRPELNKNSTNKRVVYAANIAILDRNKKYVKNTKTLL